jgi:hypothetical protein
MQTIQEVGIQEVGMDVIEDVAEVQGCSMFHAKSDLENRGRYLGDC